MTLPRREFARALEEVRYFKDIERSIGGPQAMRELFDQAQRIKAHVASLPVPLWKITLPALPANIQSVLQQIPRPIPNWGNPNSLCSILESAKLELELHFYKQALACFEGGHYEACNAMLRSFLEGLLMTIYKRVANGKAKGDTSAVDKLKNKGLIIYKEDAKFLHDTIEEFNTNGSHPGYSNKEEASSRIHNATLLGHFLLKDYSYYKKTHQQNPEGHV